MHLNYIMCFSNSIICLLVVTCHGTLVNAYPSDLSYEDNNDRSRFHDTSHISSSNVFKPNKTETELQVSVAHQQQANGNFIEVHHEEVSHVSSKSTEVAKQNSTKIKRRPRRAEHSRLEHEKHQHNNSAQQFFALPEPPHAEAQPHNSLIEGGYPPSENHHEGNGASYLNANMSPPAHKNDQHGVSCIEDEEEDDQLSAHEHQHHAPSTQNISGKVWLYSSLAVVLISLCGLLSVAVIPIMQKWFYHTLLQFLVGLAVGSLAGDGLLHLMPHAILDGEEKHGHSKEAGHNHTDGNPFETEMKAIWRGLAALCGIFLFFIAERLLGALTAHRRQKKENTISRHPKNMIPMPREEGTNNGSVGEKLAQPKKNSYDHIREKDEKETIQMLQTEPSPSKKGSNQSIHEIGFHGRSSFSVEPEVIVAYRPDSDSSVIVSEHHGHGHAHSHEIPQSVSAVAWMVIMGDGLHNFCDGLAIGAAFASGDADGLSTTVAVFCHELPHELGDFAMLLKTGMKVKQALFYNGLSSVLCFIGMVIGVSLGNVHSATNWVFAGTAGMFLYIALVDMLPELSAPANTPGISAITTLIVQVLGISIGIIIMLLIALYEHELHSIVS